MSNLHQFNTKSSIFHATVYFLFPENSEFYNFEKTQWPQYEFTCEEKTKPIRWPTFSISWWINTHNGIYQWIKCAQNMFRIIFFVASCKINHNICRIINEQFQSEVSSAFANSSILFKKLEARIPYCLCNSIFKQIWNLFC